MAPVGMGTNIRVLKITKDCQMGNIMHELGHVIGLHHEHRRPDRDDFVKIDTENIKQGKSTSFSYITQTILDLFVIQVTEIILRYCQMKK